MGSPEFARQLGRLDRGRPRRTVGAFSGNGNGNGNGGGYGNGNGNGNGYAKEPSRRMSHPRGRFPCGP